MDRYASSRAVVPDVARIGILRANSLGDFVFTLPALAALRAAYPGAELVLLGRAWHAAFLHGRGVVERVLAVPEATPGEAPWLGATEAEMRAFVHRAAAQDFDVLLQLHGGGRHSNSLVRAIGARVTAGLRTPNAASLDRWIPYVYYQPEPLRLLEVVRLVGAVPVDLDPSLPVTDFDRRRLADEVGVRERPDVVLHPGATDPRRRWPAERFAAVGDAMARRGLRVAVTGGESERGVTQAVVRRMRSPALDLGGATSLAGLTALLAPTRLVISNDSGPLHLAYAVGAPTVGIYWFGNLVNGGPATRERHRPVLSWTNACPACGRSVREPRCEHDDSFVGDVKVADVLDAIGELLDGTPSADVA